MPQSDEARRQMREREKRLNAPSGILTWEQTVILLTEPGDPVARLGRLHSSHEKLRARLAAYHAAATEERLAALELGVRFLRDYADTPRAMATATTLDALLAELRAAGVCRSAVADRGGVQCSPAVRDAGAPAPGESARGSI